MGDLGRVGGALARLLVRGAEAVLGGFVLLSRWLLGEVPAGPNAPEAAGTFTWGFLLAGFVATVALVLVVGAHLLVAGYRAWSASSWRSLRRPTGRLAAEVVAGAVVAVATPLGNAGGGLLLVPAVLAWAVLVHQAVDAARFGRDRLRTG